MRIFIALLFSNAEKTHFYHQIKKISDRHSGNFTTYNNLHLTLHYIGEVDKQLLNKMKTEVNKINFPSFNYKTEKLDCFKNTGNHCLVHMKINNNPMLNKLYKKVINSLQDSGIQIINQKFTPHITLGRKVKINYETISQYNYNPREISANRISIMESKRVDGELIYEEINFCLLKD
ncbi:MAG: RNA 2',3'-cyclic phosphodiesterase [Candidatus Izimaplasma sp.]|nr:RNA 2',3'-cyclic phosphodiesterase [Candidatus Izimaplasma bacterium]